MLSAVFWGELIYKFITIDTKFFNKYIKALFINHCDVIHSIFISVLGAIIKQKRTFHFIRKYEQENVKQTNRMDNMPTSRI